jgi:hypothetical protein
MERNKFPLGWDEERIRRLLEHYEKQTEDEAIAEDEAAWLHEHIAAQGSGKKKRTSRLSSSGKGRSRR